MKKLIFCILIFFAAVFAGFCEMYKANAEASFYAEKFHGRKTANGEIFNMYDFTAAHKTLPFNTILKITNISNGKSVTVRVNDRGPFVAGREIDLSKAAAEKLGMLSTGTAQVSIEILQLGAQTAVSKATANAAKNTPTVKSAGTSGSGSSNVAASSKNATVSGQAAAASSGTGAAATSSARTSASKASASKDASVTEEVAVLLQEPEENLRWDIQIGSFSERSNAEALAQKLLKAGFKNVVYQKAGNITRVVIRDIPTQNVQGILDRLEEKGFRDYLVKRRV